MVGEVVDEVFKGFSWVEKVFLLRVAFGFDVCLGFGRYSYQVPCQKEVFLDDFGWVPSWNECVPTISIKWLRKPNLILIYGKKKTAKENKETASFTRVLFLVNHRSTKNYRQRSTNRKSNKKKLNLLHFGLENPNNETRTAIIGKQNFANYRKQSKASLNKIRKRSSTNFFFAKKRTKRQRRFRFQKTDASTFIYRVSFNFREYFFKFHLKKKTKRKTPPPGTASRWHEIHHRRWNAIGFPQIGHQMVGESSGTFPFEM